MKARWLVLVPVLAAARSAHADPRELAIDSSDLTVAVTGLLEQHEEPIGLLALDDNPKLGLAKGDLVRAINGQSATRMSLLTEGGALFYLDVMHGNQPFVVRIAVKLDAAENTISRDQYRDRVQQLQRFGPDLISSNNHVLTQVKKAGAPSGVMVRSAAFGFGTLNEGDVIRKIDGVEVETIEQAVAALARAKNHPEIAITIERLDQTLVKTLRIEDSLSPDPAVAAASGGLKTASNEGSSGLFAPPISSCAREQKAEIGWSLGLDTNAATVAVASRAPAVPVAKTREVNWALELGNTLGSERSHVSGRPH